ncbi:cytochrome b5-like heme/steroid binding domain-containing protein, partial [Gorgonomyces haynaldii]
QFPSYESPQRLMPLSRKQPLQPGYSPLDWSRLSSKNLSGVDQIKRYTPKDLESHNTEQDMWIGYNGKVYNCTRYIPFHPEGGKKQLMRGAGKECTALIQKTHPWVNIEKLLENCFVGYLV